MTSGFARLSEKYGTSGSLEPRIGIAKNQFATYNRPINRSRLSLVLAEYGLKTGYFCRS